ncbi:MAG TPA: glycosyltransferase family 4 protein [Myxococcota bacterium]|nr:glycosyltransferase family 4 protein [Myxococcota bacterium]
MERPCRVLVLNERDPRHPRAGGAETHVAEIFTRLAARGFGVVWAASSFPGAPASAREGGVEILRLGGLARYYPRVAWACARETRRGRFDAVVECLNKVPFFSPLYSAAPVLALCHHLFGETAFQQVAWPIAAGVWLAERPLPLAYRRRPFVAISESSRDDLVRRGIPADRIRVSHCGIRRPKVEAPPMSQREPLVVYVGRLEAYKRIDLLVRAMARVRERVPAAELVVVGRGSERSRLEALARELGLGAAVRFPGFVTDDERDAWLARARASACASDKEGWGLTVIEANAVGTPVVATDAPGLRDSVRHGETGFLVAPGDVRGFADRITELLTDGARAARLSERALEWARTFDWDLAARDMADALALTRAER